MSAAADAELEREWLGSVLLEPSTIDAHPVAVDAFFDRRNVEIAKAMYRLRAEGTPIEPPSIRAELQRTGRLSLVGDDHLINLLSRVPSPASAGKVASAIRRFADLRATSHAAMRTLNAVHDLDLEGAAEQLAAGLEIAQRDETETPRAVQAPTGLWVGSLAELNALDLPEPVALGAVGAIPIVSGESTLLNGPSGRMKTLLAFHAACVAALAGARSLIFEAEGSLRATRHRLGRIGRGLRHDGLGGAAANITIVHGAFILIDHVRMWRELIKRHGPEIIVVDPLVSYFSGDENSAADMTAFTRAIDTRRDGMSTGAAVILIHHNTKEDENGRSRVRGSGALKGWADSQIELAVGSSRNEIIATHSKARETEPQPPQALTWRFDDERIELHVDGAAEDASTSASARTKTTRILGLLAERDMTAGDLRKALGDISGTRCGELLAPLLASGRVHKVAVTRKDSIGRPRAAEVLRLSVSHGEPPESCPSDRPADERPSDEDNAEAHE